MWNPHPGRGSKRIDSKIIKKSQSVHRASVHWKEERSSLKGVGKVWGEGQRGSLGRMVKASRKGETWKGWAGGEGVCLVGIPLAGEECPLQKQ